MRVERVAASLMVHGVVASARLRYGSGRVSISSSNDSDGGAVATSGELLGGLEAEPLLSAVSPSASCSAERFSQRSRRRRWRIESWQGPFGPEARNGGARGERVHETAGRRRLRCALSREGVRALHLGWRRWQRRCKLVLAMAEAKRVSESNTRKRCSVETRTRCETASAVNASRSSLVTQQCISHYFFLALQQGREICPQPGSSSHTSQRSARRLPAETACAANEKPTVRSGKVVQ